MNVAPVDELRALPAPLARAVFARLEREHGPEIVAALRYNYDWFRRPDQELPTPEEQATIEVFAGERGTGKTWTAMHLFVREVLSGRAKRPRIIAAIDAAIEATVLDGASGIRTWLPPHIRCEYTVSTGFAGTLYLGNTKVLCCSAAAPGQAIGQGVDLDFRDDPAGWVEACGAAVAEKAWTEASKSTREGLCHAIVATTPEGVAFLTALLKPGEMRGVRIHDFGAIENNRNNLPPKYLRDTVADLRARGQWNKVASDSPFADFDFGAHRSAGEPKLQVLGVAIDVATSSTTNSCEVGIVGGGEGWSTVHVLRDVSAVLNAGITGWPTVAWDLAEELKARFPGVSFRFIVETNKGGNQPAALLRAEERRRRLEQGLPGVSVVEIREVVAKKSKPERAVAPRRVGDGGQLLFASGMQALEDQLRNLRDDGGKSDRADAAVHLVNDLAGLDAIEVEETDPKKTFAGFVEAQERMPAPAFGGRSSRDEDYDRV